MSHRQPGVIDRIGDGKWSHSRSSRAVLAGLLALLPMAALLALTIGSNTPAGPRLPLESIRHPVETTAVLGPSLGGILLGLEATDPSWRVGLLFAGVFGGMAAVWPFAAVAAAVALLGVALLVMVSDRRWRPESAVSIVLAAGVAVGMIGLLGVESALARTVGSLLVGLGLAGLPALTGLSRLSVGVATVAAGLVAVVGLAAPVMLAAVSLLGMGYVGLSLPLLVVATGGAIGAVVAGVESDRPGVGLGALLVFVAGVPSSIAAGVTLLVGLALLDGVGAR